MKSFFILVNFCFITILLIQKGLGSSEIDPEHLKYDADFISKTLQEYIDESVSPCDDFYQFTCGKWLQNKKLKEESNDIDSSSLIEYRFGTFLSGFINGDYNDQSKALNKLYKMLTLCWLESEERYDDICGKQVLSFATFGFVSFYLNKKINKEKIMLEYDALQKIFIQVKNEFKLVVEERKDLLDDESKEKILDKIQRLSFFTEFSDLALDNELMEQCYDFFTFNENESLEQMFENIKNYDSFIPDSATIKNRCKFVMSKKNAFYINANIMENAHYLQNENVIVIQPVFIKEPRFSLRYPNSFNYGSLGFVIGHEIVHGFDNIGVNHNINGTEKFKLLTENSEVKFNEATNCFEKQYNTTKEETTGINLNGFLTLGENIADNAGIKIAHKAYLKYLEKIGGEEPKIPGFEKYTGEQLFFINFARSLCHYTNNTNIIEAQLKSDHLPHKSRVMLTLANYKPFSNIFKCNSGTRMNPKDKCELWRMYKNF
ncbi:Phosphate-regulating neutral endopeptidase [Strongyloides ratti]|uniref:Phosphate-regulating neutral endopeptidase n=1 Tax=Strongyloides ratti TaxID=34506 RepID=A0A090KQU7_STRRB|nr:Phosphate-regulating neutral endopeptidase [Strongyloides ratti]CEF59729.1 Phosphate-regulating neutral endopeptidase [Strongyloides ratti]